LQTNDNTMNKNYYIGLDVHKETIAIAYTKEGSRNEPTYHSTCGGSNPAAERALRSLARKLKVAFKDLRVCYEAGPTGFVLARRLLHLGVECVVMSPSKTERKPGERVKTDKRDAKKIAKLFRNGDITEVRVPPALDEAVRDVCRARTDASDDLARARQRLNAFLLRRGFRYSGKSRWTPAHMRYLRELVMPCPVQKIVLEEYILAIDSAIERDLSSLADGEHYLFTLSDLAVLLPEHYRSALKILVSRVSARGVLERVCRGLYLYPGVSYPADLLLYHAAARLRARSLCYLSMESVLSDAGVISQIPLQWITLMTSGLSGMIS
jgi:transposase